MLVLVLVSPGGRTGGSCLRRRAKGGFIDLLHVITIILYVILMQTYRDLLVWQKGI